MPASLLLEKSHLHRRMGPMEWRPAPQFALLWCLALETCLFTVSEPNRCVAINRSAAVSVKVFRSMASPGHKGGPCPRSCSRSCLPCPGPGGSLVRVLFASSLGGRHFLWCWVSSVCRPGWWPGSSLCESLTCEVAQEASLGTRPRVGWGSEGQSLLCGSGSGGG